MRRLTKQDALLRSKSVLTGVEYEFYFNFKKGKSYHGNMRARFALKNVENVFLDFSGKKIVNFKINDQALVTDEKTIETQWTQGKLHLKPEWLVRGFNTLEIKFDNDYNTDGNGLHTYNDLDGKQYTYTQSEPYYFNKVVPVFDQPDIKGRVRFYFMHPKDWLVISNTERQVQISDLCSEFVEGDDFLRTVVCSRSEDFSGDSQVLSIHRKTKRISSYLYSMVLGPYECISLPESERFRNIPMSIYYRKSLEEYAIPQSKCVFEVSKKGIEFYEKFFGHKYPFSKWDTAFCPEFTVGAMEYPGVVTYNDQFIFKEKHPSRSRISYLCTVILHEMAHMWYGDYVTMRWWDGLWLNESFAEFMNYKSFSEVQKTLSFETDDAWSMMNSGKNWGYSTDANSNTHPIECDVVDTNKADAIFDGITYSKGASVIQQLYYLVGDELFRTNIKNYFEEFKWGNTDLEDLLRHMEHGNENLDLREWNKQWIETAGTNTVKVEWDVKVQGKQTIKIHQGALLESFGTLRRHKMDLAFYNNNGEVAMVKTVDLLNQAVTQIQIENQDFVAVLPNANDWSFVAVQLDQISRDFFVSNLSKLQELAMLLIVRSLYSDVKQAKIKADVFISVLLPNLEKSLANPTLVKEFGGFITSAISYIPHALREKQKQKLFQTVWGLAENVENKTVLSELKRSLMASAGNAEQITLLYQASTKQHELGKKMAFNEKDCATINYLVVAIPGVDSELKKKAKETITSQADKNEAYKNRKFSVEAFCLDSKQKMGLWNSQVLNSKRSLSYVELIYTLLGLRNKYNSESDRKALLEQYFKQLPLIIQNEEKQIIETYMDYALPYWPDTKWLLEQHQVLFNNIQHLKSEFVNNKLLTEIDEYKALLKAFALYE